MNTESTSLREMVDLAKQLRSDREKLVRDTKAAIYAMPPCEFCGKKIAFEADPRESILICRHVFDRLRQMKGSGIEAPGPAALIFGWEVRVYSD
jgi:hypothetical protein